MRPELTGVDHVILGVRDLEAARAQWARLGFNSTPRGRHQGWGTANYCVMLEEGYVELLGILDPSQFTNHLDRFLAEREGGLGFVLGTGDPEALHAAWQAVGLEPAPPRALGRLLELPEGRVELRFRNVMLEPAATAGLSLFACTHLTPELLRRPTWLAHPNGAQGLLRLTVVAPDPEPVRLALAKVLGASALTRTDRVWAAHAGGCVILVARPEDAELLHPAFADAIADAPAAPLLQVLAVRVADPDRAARFLDLQGVPYDRDPLGAVLVAPEHAGGMGLELAAQ